MLDAAREAIDFSTDKSRADLDTDRKLALALVKCIEIIGEAAANVSAETKAQCPQVPWKDAMRMRNRLIHAYFDINLDVVWKTVVEDLPPLVSTLEPLLPPDSPLP
jgi:uncharacterized protein with HEPN domain